MGWRCKCMGNAEYVSLCRRVGWHSSRNHHSYKQRVYANRMAVNERTYTYVTLAFWHLNGHIKRYVRVRFSFIPMRQCIRIHPSVCTSGVSLLLDPLSEFSFSLAACLSPKSKTKRKQSKPSSVSTNRHRIALSLSLLRSTQTVCVRNHMNCQRVRERKRGRKRSLHVCVTVRRTCTQPNTEQSFPISVSFEW